MTSTLNQTVVDFLTYYTEAERELDYAVMLDGAWGSGKTHLIRRFLEDHKASGGQHLYVSLYGITSVKQIEEEFYRLMHPVLAHKGMRIAGVVARGLAKGLLKVDLASTGHESLTVGLPDISFADYMSGPSRHLLVFDDLERCMMKTSDVMGYINAFVEHDGMKVIILANEAEIIRRDADFPSIKEKLIGQTLRVTSDVAAAFPEFLAMVADVRVRQLLDDNRDQVLKIHAQSQTNNLRILKQAMWDFERLARFIPDEHWRMSDPILRLLALTLALSMDIRFGRLQAPQLDQLPSNGLRRYLRMEKGDEPGLDEQFEKRYEGISLLDPPFSAEVLGRIILEGLSDRDLVIQTLAENRHFAKAADLPAWVRAWHGFESSDEAYRLALAEVIDEFEQRRERQPHILYHMFGILLLAAEIGALDKTREEVLADGKAYVDAIEADDSIPTAFEAVSDLPHPPASGGLGFTESETTEFQAFVAYYREAAARATRRAFPVMASTLLERAVSDPDEFMLDLCVNGVRLAKYGHVPILAASPAKDFADMLLGLAPDAQIRMFRMFTSRYEHGSLDRDLACEKAWLSEMRDILMRRLPDLPPMSRHRVNAMVRGTINPFLDPEPARQEP